MAGTDAPPSPQPAGGGQAENLEAVAGLARQSDLIFAGTVVALGSPPSHWAGRFPAYQDVGYELNELIKGEAPAGAITVSHLVVRNSPTAQGGDTPGLSPQLFRKGAKLLVFAVKDKQGRWLCPDERAGVLPYAAEVVQKVRGALSH